MDEFEYQEEENTKWILRQIYYRERNYFNRTGKFSDKIDELGLHDLKVKGYDWPPKIEYTTNLFEAILISIDGKEMWHIS